MCGHISSCGVFCFYGPETHFLSFRVAVSYPCYILSGNASFLWPIPDELRYENGRKLFMNMSIFYLEELAV